MPIDLTISSAATPLVSPDRTQTHQPTQSFQPAAPAQTGAKAPGPPPPSPTLRFDATADMLVIEFHNDAGAVTNSIPTQQQLEAYRSHEEYGSSPAFQAAPTNPVTSVAAGTTSSPFAGPGIAT